MRNIRLIRKRLISEFCCDSNISNVDLCQKLVMARNWLVSEMPKTDSDAAMLIAMEDDDARIRMASVQRLIDKESSMLYVDYSGVLSERDWRGEFPFPARHIG